MALGWVTAVIGVGGTLLGVGLGHGLTWWRQSRERESVVRGHLEALKAEILYCGHVIQECHSLGAGLLALRRLPTNVFANSFPALLTQGVFSSDDSNALLQFYADADRVNKAFKMFDPRDGRQERFTDLVRDARSTSLRLMPGKEGNTTTHDRALSAITRHLVGPRSPRLFRTLESLRAWRARFAKDRA